MFGTIDSWLIYRLTGRHATDPSNASRTMLFDIRKRRWDEGLLSMLGVPRQILPEVLPSSGFFGTTHKELFGSEIPVTGVAGDQQAALFGHACFEPGEAKNTYGTGCFTLMNAGPFPIASAHNLLTTVAWDLGDGYTYALEGSVFIAGAVIQWLRDQMGLLADSAESEALARSVSDTGGVYLVPAFVGLGAPYWDSGARGTIVGITRGTTRAHFVRAALEAIAYESRDLLDAMEKDSGRALASIKADGGASANSFLMQFQADITNRSVVLPEVAETTALGAAYLAGLAVGYWDNLDDVKRNWRQRRAFTPAMDEGVRAGLVAGWEKAVAAARTYR
jgi:glycerol kinase